MCCMNFIVISFPCVLLTCRLVAWVSHHVVSQLTRSPSTLKFYWVIGLDCRVTPRLLSHPSPGDGMIPNEGILRAPMDRGE